MISNIKKFLAGILAVALAFASVNTGSVGIALARETVRALPSIAFTVTDTNGEGVDMSDSTVLRISENETMDPLIQGSVSPEGNVINFTSAEALDEETTYYYTLGIPGYETARGSFGGSVHSVPVIVSRVNTGTLEPSSVVMNDFTVEYGDVVSLIERVQLPATYSGEVEFFVKSSDAGTLENGVLTAVAPGEIQITVVAHSDSVYAESTDTCTVTVTAKELTTLQGGDIDWNQLSFEYSGASYFQLTGSVKSDYTVNGDVVRVTATVHTKSSSVGMYAAVITDYDFEENPNYELAFAENASVSIVITKKTNELEVTDIYMNYGDPAVDVYEYFTLPDGYNGTVTLTSEADAITLDDHLLTVNKTGEYVITVTASETDTFEGATAIIKVFVNAKPIGAIGAGKINWNNTSFTYTGEDTFVITGTVNPTILLEGDTVTVVATVRTPSANAGVYDAEFVSITFESGGLYDISLEEGSKIGVTIRKRPIEISAKDYTVNYASSEWYSACAGGTVDGAASDLIIVNETSETILEECYAVLNGNVSLKVAPGFYLVGVHTGKVSVQIGNIENTNFYINRTNIGDLRVVTEVTYDDESAWERVELDKDASSYSYTDGKTVYVGPGGLAVFKVRDDVELYDSVAIIVNSRESNSIPGSNVSGNAEGEFYLYDRENPDTRTDASSVLPGNQNNSIPEGAVIYDADAPVISINNNEAQDEVVYTLFLNGDPANIFCTVTDAASGVAEIMYAVVTLDPAEPIVPTLADLMQKVDWMEYDPEAGVIIPSPAADGYYVLLITATDNVGNSSVVMGDAVIYDTTDPDIRMAGIQQDVVYGGGVDYSIRIADSGSICSGLKNLSVQVSVNGEIVPENNDGSMTGSFSISEEEMDELFGVSAPYTNEDVLLFGGSKTLNCTIPADYNSSEIVITVTLTDKAGNTYVRVSKVSIDTTAPEIEVSYDNNIPSHDRFFNSERTAYVNVVERDYNEENLIFSISVDGIAYTVNAVELREGRVPSVRMSETHTYSGDEEDDTHTVYTIIFGEEENCDHDYTVSASLTDNAGNTCESVFAEGTEAGADFTVDKTVPEPVLTFVSGNEPFDASTDAATVYSAQSITATLNVTERNICTEDTEVVLTETDRAGNITNTYSEEDLAKILDENQWLINGDNEFVFAPFNGDSNYTLTLTVYDKAGNRASVPVYRFTVDRTAPSGRITVDGTHVYDSLYDSASFCLFSNSLIYAMIEADDPVSGVASVKYAVYNPPVDAHGDFEVPVTVDELENMGWSDIGSEIVFEPNSQSVLYARIEDRAGNVAYLNANEGVICDNVAPYIEIETLTETETGVYGDSVDVRVNVTDPVNNTSYAGLKEIGYSVTCDGEETQSGVFTDGLDDPAARIQNFIREVTVDAALNNSNSVRITFYAEDYAGNRSELYSEYAIDTTVPEIGVSFDNNAAINGYYFNSMRTATVTVTERNFVPENVIFEIKVDGRTGEYTLEDLMNGVVPGVVAYFDYNSAISADSLLTDDAATVFTVTFGEDGETDHDYEWDITVTDAAGNTSEGADFGSSVAGDRFVIDEIVPELNAVFTTKGMPFEPGHNGETIYFNSDVTATLNVTERNLNVEVSLAALEQKDAEGNDVIAYSDEDLQKICESSSWSYGDRNVFVFEPFGGDANYVLTVTLYDMAGNSVSMPAAYFTVDKTAPTGVITVDGEGEYNSLSGTAAFHIFSNEGIAASISASDLTSEIAVVRYAVYNPPVDASGEFEVPTGENEMNMLGWMTPEEAISITPNEQAVIYAMIIDMAGNVTYINTEDGIVCDDVPPTGRIETVSGDEKIFNNSVTIRGIVNDPVQNEAFSGLKNVVFTVINNGEQTQSVSYANELSDETAKIREFIKEAVIEAELNNSNNVRAVFTAEDYAGNVFEMSELYAIDTTNPVVSVSFDNNSAENGFYFNRQRTATVTVRERNWTSEGIVFDISIDGASNAYTLADLLGGRAQGVTAVYSSSQDSGADTPFNELTDDRTIVIYVTFGANGETDHHYRWNITVTDEAGNVSDGVDFGSSVAGDDFVVDEIAPVIDASFATDHGAPVTPGLSEEDRSYSSTAVVPTVIVTEHNFSENGLTVTASGTDYEGRPAGNPGVTPAGWSAQGDRHSAVINGYTQDANYIMSASFTDLAGNTAELAPRYFTVDKTAPYGSIHVSCNGETGDYGTYAASLRFWFYTNDSATISQTSDDDTSGIASVSYWVYVPEVNAHGTFSGPSVEELRRVDWTAWNSELRLSPERQSVVYARLVDKASNETYINTADGIVLDTTSPDAPEISITAGDPERIYNSDVLFAIHVTDPVSGGTYSGLKSVSYEILNNGTVTQSENYDSDLGDRTARVQSITRSETISAAHNNSNNVIIRVYAEDYAGNRTTAEQRVMIDITDPVIDIVYDRNDGLQDRYYNTARTATVRVTERNFDPSGITLEITSVLGQKARIGSWDLASNMGESDSAVSTLTVIFDADDDYTVTASVRDLAGNTASLGRTDSFTIDRTLPVIDVTYDNNNVLNGRYYNTPRTATVTVTERNFDEAQCTAQITAMVNGQLATTPVLSAWTHSGDKHTAAVYFPGDADYTFAFGCTDKAGNTAGEYSAAPFTVDANAPEIIIEGVEDRHAYNGPVQPVVTFTDVNAGEGTAVITYEGARHDKYEAAGTVERIENGARITLPDFEDIKDNDDVYTMTVTFTDLAGNATTEQITFSINRYGSNFTFDEATAKYVEDYYHSAAQELVIYETNVNELVHQSITVGYNGSVTTLEQGRDYTVTDKETDGWKVYEYRIHSDSFNSDGIYEIIITSTDMANNTQDNKLKDAPISFVIDTDAPSCTITGIHNNEQYNDTQKTFVIHVSDNVASGSVKVMVNGQLYKEYTAEEVREMGGAIEVTVNESDDYQTIQAIACDAAGNETASDSVRILVTTNPWMRFCRNTPAFVGSIAGAGAACGGLALLFALKKKKKKEKAGESAAADAAEEAATETLK